MATIDIAGAKRPDIVTKNTVVNTSVTPSGAASQRVITNTEIIVNTDTPHNTCNLSNLSESRPNKFVENNVTTPLQKYINEISSLSIPTFNSIADAMNGATNAPANNNTPDNANPRTCTLCVKIARICATGEATARTDGTDGSANAATSSTTKLTPASKKNGACHPNRPDSHKPAGKPITCATGNAAATTAIPRPLRSGPITSASIAPTTELATPPHNPVNVRVTSNHSYERASAHPSVPTANPAYKTSKVPRRGSLSITNPAPKPTTAADRLYAAVNPLHFAGEISKRPINSPPRGRMIMKSSTCVNCTAARMNNNSRSLATGGGALYCWQPPDVDIPPPHHNSGPRTTPKPRREPLLRRVPSRRHLKQAV